MRTRPARSTVTVFPMALLAAGVAACTACSGAAADPITGTTTGTPSPDAGTAAGVAVDTRGQPIADALVWLEPALTTGVVTTHTGADGRYAANGLTRIPYYAKAWTQVAYRGKTYCLRLAGTAAADYDAFTLAAGAVRNFRWQLTGKIPDLDDQSFGGEVRLMGDGTAPASSDVELTFTPTGPLIDGSTGQVVRRTVKAYDIAQDVPAGAYTVTAAILASDGTRTPLQVGTGYGDAHDAMPLEFQPTTSPSCSNGSGLARAFVYWTRPGAA